MSIIGTELYLAGSYAPSLLYNTLDLPELDYPERPHFRDLKINITDIVVTAVIFITIITWFNVLSHLYEDAFHPGKNGYQTTFLALGYAILVTLISLVIYYLFSRKWI